MEDDLDASVIRNTQLSLGKYVKRPPLSDKLLRKPPFRFLHDIVTSLNSTKWCLGKNPLIIKVDKDFDIQCRLQKIIVREMKDRNKGISPPFLHVLLHYRDAERNSLCGDAKVSVHKSKGFFEGLFEENELISENVKDRESKISFLNKVIAVVSLTTGKSLTVKPSKIVAGQEPLKTNELLQCLAEALDNNLSSDQAVKQLKSGTKISTNNEKKNKETVKPLKKNIESKKLTSKSNEKFVANEKDGQTQNKPKNKDISVPKKESPPKKSLPKTSNKKPSEKSNHEGKKNNTIEQNNISSNQKPSDNISKSNQEVLHEDTININKDTNPSEKNVEPEVNSLNELSDNVVNQTEAQQVFNVSENIIKPTSAKKSMLINEHPHKFQGSKEENTNSIDSSLIDKDENEHKNEPKIQSTHNSEASGASETFQMESELSNRFPAVNNFDKKDSNTPNIIRPTSVRPSSSRPGAPRIRDKSDFVINDAENILVGKVNIISENTLNEEEEDSSIVIENNITEQLNETFQNQDHNKFENQNSHLVQQILDSQREFSQISGKTDIEWQFGTQKTPDIFIQEMEQLKFSVQALSRIANPLGKLLDHIQEDVEVMRQELQQWKQLYEDTSKDLLMQKNATNEALLPFHTKLKQLTMDMEDRREKITDLKISIHKNDLRIEKLLTNSNVQ